MFKQIPSDIKKIIEENKYSGTLKKYSNKYNFNNNSVYSKVRNNGDVEIYYNFVKNTINHYENNFPYRLIYEDIETMEKSLANYESALGKVLQCYGNQYCDFNYTATELQELIDSVSIFADGISRVGMKMLCQD